MPINVDLSQVRESRPLKGMPKGGRILSTFDAFEQSVYWKGMDGFYLISSMTPSHRQYVCKLLLSGAMTAQTLYLLDVLEMIEGPYGPRGEWATVEASRSFEQLTDMDPREWLRSTPLWKRLSLGLDL